MKTGDLVSVLYESRRYYIILGKVDDHARKEEQYLLYGLKDGIRRIQVRSEIKVINEA